MAANDFLPFATDIGANVLNQASYAVLAARSSGYEPGLAQSAQANKTWRQAAFVASSLAQLMANVTGVDVLDDGNQAAFLITLASAIRSAAGGLPDVTVTGATHTYATTETGKLVLRSNGNTADNTMVDTLPGSGPGILPADSILQVTNGDTASLLVVQAGAGAVLKNTATGFVIIGPGQFAEFVSDGTNYWPVSLPDRAHLRATTTCYVDAAGSNGNHGLTPGSPKATLDNAWNTMQQALDLNSNALRFQLANGSYTGGLLAAQGPFVGQIGPTSVVINGNANPALVVINTVNNDAFLAGWGTSFFLQGVTVQSSGTAKGIHVADGGNVQIGNVTFGAFTAGLAQCYVEGGVLSIIAPCAMTGGSGAHMFATGSGSKIIVLGNTHSLAGTPLYTNAFAVAQLGAEIFANGALYSGAAGVGTKRYLASYNANISTGGGGATFFPGNVAGTADAATFANYL